ncbi:monofunctional biosynthetic peptidoglycan transglycosylase [Prosthecochloris sp. GSB1]|uniref:monofunctional biosynthetic peptidoglycan transglycosylase n=1 Tax=Prosthecochloris sp. GSB1 TaxID=281093 RepID=UPI000B8D0CD3|nr:monofunctional biosynthetic peptidoglycan transglycosylase [Prosthecochloris sp. GSB1]ASQ91561.1 monofunctional biosynthetic peptidoglycan transglycosylase [Prosthecochloris sp. GSB1]
MRILLQVLLLFGLLIAVDIGRYFALPDIGALREKNPEKTAYMRYREQQWRDRGVRKEVRNRWVPLSRISRSLQRAVLVSEDRKFWEHEGFDYEAIEEAVQKNVRKKAFAFGASTITQQLARNLYLSPSKSPVRKLKEAILTWRIERALPKERILELYLNVAEWGDGIFGIEEAARHYYRKSASRLSAREAARLAAVLPNPIRFSPTRPSRYIERRADRIYRMAK